MTSPGRLELAPLAALEPSPTALARRLGVDPAQIHRWRRYGLTLAQAEDMADRLGLHPAELWGDYCAAMVPCALCEEPFAPRSAQELYCSPGCKRVVANRQANARKRARRAARSAMAS